MPIEIWWQENGKSGVPGEHDQMVLEGAGPFRIGRSGQSTIMLDHPQVSRTHTEITIDGTRVKVADAGSQNGTFISGERVTAAVWMPDKELTIGPFTLHYRWIEARGTRREQTRAGETAIAAVAPGRSEAARPAAAAGGAFPGRLFDTRIVPMAQIRAAGKIHAEVNYCAIGGGIGSFVWVDHLRCFGVQAKDIRVLGVAADKTPYAKYGRLCRNSQIPLHERIRSNSISAPDNIWGFPGYASREMVRDLLRGRLAGLKYILQVFGEPSITETYTPRRGDVFNSLDREAARIGWYDMFVGGRCIAIRKTDDERFAIAYRVSAEHDPDLPADQRDRFVIARNVQIATGYPASNFLPDLQDFRRAHPNSTVVVNAYEEHDDVYRTLEARGGTVLLRGRGIVASRVIQRLCESRQRNKDIRILHLVRSPIKKGTKYDLSRRAVRHDVEQQPFNWPKGSWGGTMRKRLEAASPEERPKLLAIWGGTSTADRDDWNRIIDEGQREGWYKIAYGQVASITEKGDQVVTRLESSVEHGESLDLTADYIIDCTGLVANIDETPFLADLIKAYDLPRNRASGAGAELRLAGIFVSNSFEIEGLQNGRGRVYAAGVVAANGPYATVDTFLGLQYVALRSVDHLAAQGAPGVSRLGPFRSSYQWLKWCAGAPP